MPNSSLLCTDKSPAQNRRRGRSLWVLSVRSLLDVVPVSWSVVIAESSGQLSIDALPESLFDRGDSHDFRKAEFGRSTVAIDDPDPALGPRLAQASVIALSRFHFDLEALRADEPRDQLPADVDGVSGRGLEAEMPMLGFLDLSGQAVAVLHDHFVGLDREYGCGEDYG